VLWCIEMDKELFEDAMDIAEFGNKQIEWA
jgi:hypothetical protein